MKNQTKYYTGSCGNEMKKNVLSTVAATNFSIKNNFWSMETVSGKSCEFNDGGGLYDLICLAL